MQRYEAYENSSVEWIGEIPVGWDTVRTKYCFRIRKRIVGYEGPTVLSITQNGIVAKDIDSGEGQLAVDYSNYQWVYPGDFAMNHMDLLTGWVDCSSMEGVTSPDYRVFAPINDNVDRCFYTYVFQHCYTARVYYSLGQGVSGFGRWRLPANQFNNFTLPLPPLIQQEVIADYLNEKTAEIDALVEDCEREVELLQEYRKAVISESVTKGLDPSVPMKDSGIDWIGEIPANWSTTKVKYTLDSCDSKRVPVEASQRDQDSETLYPYYGASGIVDYISDYIFDEPLLLIGEDGANLRLRNLPLVYAASGKYWVNNHAHILRPCFIIDYWYAFYQLELVDLENYLTGSTQPKLTSENLGTIPLVLPSKEEQRAIVVYLDTKTAEIDSLIDAKRQMADKLREYRKSLISEAVTGKFKVPGVG